mmetsp:Transcript_124043/g.356124  ORF Transcript_124043/g.356124 Transcript_124043/m.356124 type:complete len:217 (-) Transcript_124043:361-1011(-)
MQLPERVALDAAGGQELREVFGGALLPRGAAPLPRGALLRALLPRQRRRRGFVLPVRLRAALGAGGACVARRAPRLRHLPRRNLRGGFLGGCEGFTRLHLQPLGLAGGGHHRHGSQPRRRRGAPPGRREDLQRRHCGHAVLDLGRGLRAVFRRPRTVASRRQLRQPEVRQLLACPPPGHPWPLRPLGALQPRPGALRLVPARAEAACLSGAARSQR